ALLDAACVDSAAAVVVLGEPVGDADSAGSPPPPQQAVTVSARPAVRAAAFTRRSTGAFFSDSVISFPLKETS
ncbi:hypothetical protein, partial [Micrococcus sp.]|uniref:hypothetical protein n=1 Tax=Micrococcus sp. TaxID=1271 RepID=UPI002A91AAD4